MRMRRRQVPARTDEDGVVAACMACLCYIACLCCCVITEVNKITLDSHDAITSPHNQ